MLLFTVNSPRLEINNIHAFRRAFDEQLGLQASRNIKIILDLSQVEYIDSSAIGALLASSKKVVEQDKEFFLGNVNSSVREVLLITQIDKFFQYYSFDSHS